MSTVEDREYLFLAGCMTDPTLFVVGSSLVDEGSLSVAGNIIYSAIKKLREADSSVTPELVAYELNNQGSLETIGGLTTLNAIKNIDFRLDVDGFKRISEDIRIDSRKREIKNILKALSESEEDPDTIISETIRQIYDASENNIKENIVRADKAKSKTKPRTAFASSSIDSLDSIIGGIVKSEYLILAARPSIGKTAMGLQMAANAALDGIPTLVFSLEQSLSAIMGRINRLISEEDLESLPLYLKCEAGLTIGKIMSTVQMAKLMYGIEFVVIDYIGLIGGQRMGQTTNEFLSMVSKGIQSISRKMDVGVVALAQLNRNSEREDREPALYDLRDSGSLEQDADIVVLIHRRNRDDELTKFIVAKHREGTIGSITANFNKDCVMFLERE